jgi:hypothetical protein
VSYHINPIAKDQCAFLAYEGRITPAEAESARQEVIALLDAKYWDRVVVDVARLQSIPTALELFEFSENLCLDLPRSVRIALVVRLDQARHARLVKIIAQNRRVLLNFFFDVEDAMAWVNPVNPFGATAQNQGMAL